VTSNGASVAVLVELFEYSAPILSAPTPASHDWANLGIVKETLEVLRFLFLLDVAEWKSDVIREFQGGSRIRRTTMTVRTLSASAPPA
jgi:hypothetical protein